MNTQTSRNKYLDNISRLEKIRLERLKLFKNYMTSLVKQPVNYSHKEFWR